MAALRVPFTATVPPYNVSTIWEGRVPLGGPINVNYATLLPHIHDISATVGATSTQLAWQTDGSLAGAAGGMATLAWNDPVTAAPHTWTLVFPAGSATSVATPPLPPDFDAWKPGTTTVVTVKRLSFVKSPALPGYDELRRSYFRQLGPSQRQPFPMGSFSYFFATAE